MYSKLSRIFCSGIILIGAFACSLKNVPQSSAYTVLVDVTVTDKVALEQRCNEVYNMITLQIHESPEFFMNRNFKVAYLDSAGQTVSACTVPKFQQLGFRRNQVIKYAKGIKKCYAEFVKSLKTGQLHEYNRSLLIEGVKGELKANAELYEAQNTNSPRRKSELRIISDFAVVDSTNNFERQVFDRPADLYKYTYSTNVYRHAVRVPGMNQMQIDLIDAWWVSSLNEGNNDFDNLLKKNQ